MFRADPDVKRGVLTRHLPVTQQRTRRNRGLTLIEMLVAVVILGVLAAVGVPSMLEFIAKRRVLAAADQLLVDLRYARSLQLANNNKVAVRVASDAALGCYVIYNLPFNGSCDCRNTPVCTQTSIVEHKTVLYPASGSVRMVRENTSATRVVLDGINGLPEDGDSLSIVLSAPAGGSIRVTTNAAFAPEACSVSGHSSSFAACP